ncbi:MAG: SDR family oxidoreductase [bacterium]
MESFATSPAPRDPEVPGTSIPAGYGRELPGRGRSVLVTGASSGLGLETCVHLAGLGFHVYATMRDLGRAAGLEARARAAGVPIALGRLDVTEDDSIRAAVDEIERAEGPLYGLVNNAGIIVRGYFEDLREEEIERIFRTNLFGPMAVSRAALPGMRKAGGGRIVMIGSTGGRLGLAGSSAYCTAKFALAGFSESLAQEVVPFGIRVVLVEPAIIRTELFGQNLGIARGARDPASPYAARFEALLSLSLDRSRRSGLSAVDVAKAVEKVLLMNKPPMRMTVGSRARALLLLKRIAPEEAFQRVFTWAFFRKLERAGKRG